MPKAKTKRLIILLVLAFVGFGAVWFVHAKMRRYRVVHLALTPPDTSFYTPPAPGKTLPEQGIGAARNLILLIGDGMGLGTLYLAVMAQGNPDLRLHMELMPVVGLVRTHSENLLHTDSAAGATAMATGFKTNNDYLSTLSDGTEKDTVLERARDQGRRTGVVVTCDIADDTPAAFLTHGVGEKGSHRTAMKIARALPDVLFGKRPKEWTKTPAGEGEFADSVRQKGYALVHDRDALAKSDSGRIVGLFADGGAEPTLPFMTRKALDVLSRDNEKGFFLLVEGSFIDKYAHSNNTNRVIGETLWFDLAVKEALDFAAAHRDTLVVVTADHDTGGLSFPKIADIPYLSWTSRSHTAAPVPLFAYGPGAGRFGGVLDNTDVGRLLFAALGVSAVPEAE